MKKHNHRLVLAGLKLATEIVKVVRLIAFWVMTSNYLPPYGSKMDFALRD
jgi:hypothetical protein